MLKKILAVIQEELRMRKQERLFKRISALKFDGLYFAWLVKQLTADATLTVKTTDGTVTTEYTATLAKGTVLYERERPKRQPKPGDW